MALVIYTDKKEVEQSKNDFILLNDLFFDTETNLKDDELTKIILATIDKAKYNSELTFIGRTESLGALNKSMLSTGTKTLLNIIAYPDKCFNICECGNNALSLLPFITDGCVYWRVPAVAYDGAPECDILYNGKEYKNFYKFLESVGDSFATV